MHVRRHDCIAPDVKRMSPTCSIDGFYDPSSALIFRQKWAILETREIECARMPQALVSFESLSRLGGAWLHHRRTIPRGAAVRMPTQSGGHVTLQHPGSHAHPRRWACHPEHPGSHAHPKRWACHTHSPASRAPICMVCTSRRTMGSRPSAGSNQATRSTAISGSRSVPFSSRLRRN